ncbi:hypothetical protein At12D1_22930 [Agrobacterium tumefaciens]|uniref:hypothetical protein n=1 Tax=Agrobacterium tumefaciens TaxID=358 RepID=UPI000F0C3EB2|nr:hypothetical protein [Agrobacterium tumefaciens]AYM82180.1 hypothetical protein At12D1_22930 [Agrobacterium tumefaciens]
MGEDPRTAGLQRSREPDPKGTPSVADRPKVISYDFQDLIVGDEGLEPLVEQ